MRRHVARRTGRAARRSRARPLLGAQGEGRHRLQRHGVEDAERAEARCGPAEKTSGCSPAEQRSTSPSAVTSCRPRTWVARPPKRRAGAVGAGGQRPGDGLPVDVAEVGQRPAAGGQLGVQPVQRHPGLDGDQPGRVDVEQRGVPVEREGDVVGPADGGERVAAAQRPHPPSGGRGRRQRAGDLLGARRVQHGHAVRPLVARPVAPARRSRAQRSGALDPLPQAQHAPPRDHRRRRPGPAGRGDRRPRPPAGGARPRRARRQRRRPGAPRRAAGRSGWRASRCAAARCCGGCSPDPGFAGVLAYTLAEALWLAGSEDPVSADVVVGYPTRRPVGAAPAGRRPGARRPRDADGRLPRAARPRRRRRPARDPAAAADLPGPRRVAAGRRRAGARRRPAVARALAGAGGGAGPGRGRPARVPAGGAHGLRGAGGRGAGRPAGPAPARPRRPRGAGGVRAGAAPAAGAAVAAVRAVAPTWSSSTAAAPAAWRRTAADPSVTELAAGSGLYSPTLFDGYRAFRGRPAALFALAVTRRPAPGTVTVAGGGWIASGPAGADRLPTPVYPAGLRTVGTEGAGEVQTPLRGRGRRPAADRRPRLVPARQGRRARRARRRAAHAGRRRADRRRSRPTAARAARSADPGRRAARATMERVTRPTRAAPQRNAIRLLFADLEGFHSAQDVYAKLRASGGKVGLSTVYRAVQSLADDGELDSIRTDTGEALYRRCSSQHHHHLVCRSCGRTLEVAGPGRRALGRRGRRRARLRRRQPHAGDLRHLRGVPRGRLSRRLPRAVRACMGRRHGRRGLSAGLTSSCQSTNERPSSGADSVTSTTAIPAASAAARSCSGTPPSVWVL